MVFVFERPVKRPVARRDDKTGPRALAMSIYPNIRSTKTSGRRRFDSIARSIILQLGAAHRLVLRDGLAVGKRGGIGFDDKILLAHTRQDLGAFAVCATRI